MHVFFFSLIKCIGALTKLSTQNYLIILAICCICAQIKIRLKFTESKFKSNLFFTKVIIIFIYIL